MALEVGPNKTLTQLFTQDNCVISNYFHTNNCSISQLVEKNDDRYKVKPKEMLQDAVYENR